MIMMRSLLSKHPLPCLVSHSLINRFCTQPQKKSYYIPQQPQLPKQYSPKHSIKFKNGRYLIYMNKQNLSTPFLLDLPYTMPLSYLAYLIYLNPFYLTFPAALPMMIIAEGLILLRWFSRKSFFKRQIQRIYLIETGVQIEIVYSNKIRRYVKDNPETSHHFILDFKSRYVQDEKDGKIQPLRGMRFPQNPYIQREKAEQPLLLQYGWTFRDKDFVNYIIPSRYDYADWEILTKVVNGITIDLENFNSQGIFTKNSIPDIDDEIKRLKQTPKEKETATESEKKN